MVIFPLSAVISSGTVDPNKNARWTTPCAPTLPSEILTSLALTIKLPPGPAKVLNRATDPPLKTFTVSALITTFAGSPGALRSA
jgi:hypothetical protein